VLAFAAGLVLGIGLAFVRESLDVKLHSPDEIAELTDLPLIAAIPEFRRSEKSPDQLLALDDPRGPAAEAYRFLRTNLDFVNFNNDIKVVLVTSPLPAQGKSTTIANLAVALLHAGKRVSVVEGDLRRPALHRHFKITNARGVTSVVSGTTDLSSAIHVVSFRDPSITMATARPLRDVGRVRGAPAEGDDLKLRVLTSGPLPPNPGEIVNSRQLGEILEALKADSDYVLVDAPPMFAVGDTAAMAAWVDGIIVVLRLDETTADTVKSVEDFFKRVPARALGIVVTGVPRGSKSKYYRYEKAYE
jgi:Mrp family chromosome partitioning ATPase